MVGITVFIACFHVFNSYQGFHTHNIAGNQLEEVSDLVVSEMMGLVGSREMNSTLVVSVPETVGNERYMIDLSQHGLEVSTLNSGLSFFCPLRRINSTFTLSGVFSTVHGNEFMIYKSGHKIIIG